MEFKKQSNKKILLYEDALPTVPIGYQQTYPQHLWKKVSAGPTEKYCSLHPGCNTRGPSVYMYCSSAPLVDITSFRFTMIMNSWRQLNGLHT